MVGLLKIQSSLFFLVCLHRNIAERWAVNWFNNFNYVQLIHREIYLTEGSRDQFGLQNIPTASRKSCCTILPFFKKIIFVAEGFWKQPSQAIL